MPTLTLNGQEVEFEAGMTVLQVCELAGIEVPRFCYHERLSIAGNCRMCLVQVEGGPPKPAASCAMPAGDGMVVHTDTPMVKKAREGVMEFLLINHPLDCPICDQGGECDLQDQAMAFGTGLSRFNEHKRSVKDKYMGPLIKTHMTRCIHCTRCIRFATEIAGVEELGATSRGEHMEVGTYVEKTLTSEMSGNIIDLCPVGALTSKPFAFRARSWEMKKVESIDVLDAVGSNIHVNVRGNEVMRILPRLNEAVNEEWISDKTRFAYDGLKLQRLDTPMVRKNGKLEKVSWTEALNTAAQKLKATAPENIAALAGDLMDVESIFALKVLMQGLGVNNLDCRQDGARLTAKNRASYIFNTTIEGIEDSDLCLLIGTNPRKEAPLVNARLRKRSLQGGFEVVSIGKEVDLTYPVECLGNDASTLKAIADGSHPFAERLKKAKKPMLILGMDALCREDGDVILGLAQSIASQANLIQDKWNGFNVLHQAASRVGALDIGFVPAEGGLTTNDILKSAKSGEIEVLYLLGADEIPMSELGNTFVIYQGHHGDSGAHRADIILPGAAYTEKHGTYVNTEGRVQRALRSVFPPGEAREDWDAIIELAQLLGIDIPFCNLKDLRHNLASINSIFSEVDQVVPAIWGEFGQASGALNQEPLEHTDKDFYMTDPISRASQTMAKCSAQLGCQDKEVA